MATEKKTPSQELASFFLQDGELVVFHYYSVLKATQEEPGPSKKARSDYTESHRKEETPDSNTENRLAGLEATKAQETIELSEGMLEEYRMLSNRIQQLNANGVINEIPNDYNLKLLIPTSSPDTKRNWTISKRETDEAKSKTTDDGKSETTDDGKSDTAKKEPILFYKIYIDTRTSGGIELEEAQDPFYGFKLDARLTKVHATFKPDEPCSDKTMVRMDLDVEINANFNETFHFRIINGCVLRSRANTIKNFPKIN